MNQSKTMHYIDHGQGGPASCLQMKQGSLPELKAGEVLIEVAYAGINRPDILQRAGAYPPPPDASPVLGLEVSGRITAKAADVTDFDLGDLVCALVPGGGYAEFCAVPATNCLPVPRGLTLLQAAALPENFFTVWTNVFERGRLQPGEIFLVHGGSSGIGLTAIQLAKAFAAKAYTTVGNAEKVEAVLKAGADGAINYRESNWLEVLTGLLGKQKVNVILDMVGGSYTQQNLTALAIEGRLVQIAFLQGARMELDCMPILIKRLTFTGSTLRPRSIEEKASIARALLTRVWPLLESRKVSPVIYKVFPLKEAQKAHELLETSTHIGKIMLEVRPG
ncbi:MAG TPA: NAD(P)H-quinone oxidoreductase [Thermodesulfobacteriota bacterium]|nr:NAD(P)H-quinone oxidoreductase [Thermodesulfobacteriota bacterium]